MPIIEQIDDILSRPSQQYFNAVPSFNSRTLSANWNKVIGCVRYYRDFGEPFEGHFFLHFWKMLKHLSGRNTDFRKFIERWINYAKDHSSTHAKIETCDRLLVNWQQPYGEPASPQPLRGCTRLYYLASGVNNLPNTPSDQDETPNDKTYVYKAKESHSLQKTLIKLRGGEGITIKIFKERLTEGRIIYYNKYDHLAVAYLQMYAITNSWKNYIPGNVEREPVEITRILAWYAGALQNLNATNWKAPLQDNSGSLAVLTELEKIEAALMKIDSGDNTLEAFAQDWQKRLYTTEKDQISRDLETLNANAKSAIDQYYAHMENVRKKQKILASLMVNDSDAKFLLDYFLKFKDLPGSIFHHDKSNKRLYCLYEAPYAHSSFDSMKKAINDIPEDMTPSNEGKDWKGSAYASDLNWAIKKYNDRNDGYWRKPIFSGFKDSDYWPAFMRSAKRFLMEVFVDRTITLYMSVCLRWESTSNNYQANGTNINNLPAPFQPFIKERFWHPHMTHYNCWSAAAGEIVKALSNRDPDTAFDYTLSASGQISYGDSAGIKHTGYIWGNNKGYFNDNCKDAAERMKVYQRPGVPHRECLRDILTEYIANELKACEPPPIVIPKTEIKKTPGSDTNLDDRLTWLEAHHFVPRPGINIIPIPSEDDTRFEIEGTFYVFLLSGDFLTLADYRIYCERYPTAPKSPPNGNAGLETTTIAEPEPQPEPTRPERNRDYPPYNGERCVLWRNLTDHGVRVIIANGGPKISKDAGTGTFHLSNTGIYVVLEQQDFNDIPPELREKLIAYESGRRNTGDDFPIPMDETQRIEPRRFTYRPWAPQDIAEDAIRAPDLRTHMMEFLNPEAPIPNMDELATRLRETVNREVIDQIMQPPGPVIGHNVENNTYEILARNGQRFSFNGLHLNEIPEPLRSEIIRQTALRTVITATHWTAEEIEELLREPAVQPAEPAVNPMNTQLLRSTGGNYYWRTTGPAGVSYRRISNEELHDLPTTGRTLPPIPDEDYLIFPVFANNREPRVEELLRMQPITPEPIIGQGITMDFEPVDPMVIPDANAPIQLVRQAGGWSFPRAAALPDALQDFDNFNPTFDAVNEGITPYPTNDDGVYYDLIEDVIYWIDPDLNRVVLGIEISNQLRRALPF